jgi:hypothetical protein
LRSKRERPRGKGRGIFRDECVKERRERERGKMNL